MPASVSQGRKGYRNDCPDCDIHYEPGKQRDPDYREQVGRRLEAVAQEHNAKRHAPCEG